MTTPLKPISIREAALQVAISQMGQKELPIGSNKGPMIDKYLAAVNLNPGYAWCQAFVYWCYQQAAQQLSQNNPVVKTAGVLDCWNRTAVQFKIPQAEAIKHPKLILPGYQIMFNHGKGKGHTGVVERVEGQIVHTIEGNSNSDGSREGYAVVRQKRRIDNKLLAGFIKY